MVGAVSSASLARARFLARDATANSVFADAATASVPRSVAGGRLTVASAPRVRDTGEIRVGTCSATRGSGTLVTGELDRRRRRMADCDAVTPAARRHVALAEPPASPCLRHAGADRSAAGLATFASQARARAPRDDRDQERHGDR